MDTLRFSVLSAALCSFLTTGADAQNWLRTDMSKDWELASVVRPGGQITTVGLEDGDFGPYMLRTTNYDGSLAGVVKCGSPSGFAYLPRDAGLLPGGDLVVGGSLYEDDTVKHRAFLARVDPDTGVAAWQIKPIDEQSTIARVLVGADAVYAVGSYSESTSADDYEIYLMKADFAGNVLWQLQFGFVGIGDFGLDAALTSAEEIVIAGADADYLEGHIVMFESNGSYEWNRYFDTFAPEGICVVGDEIWLAKQNYDTEIEILALDRDSDKLWSRAYQADVGDVQGMQSYEGGALIASRRLVGDDTRATLLALDAASDVKWYRAYDFEPGTVQQYFRHVVNAGVRGLVALGRGDSVHAFSLESDGTSDADCLTVTDLSTTVSATSTHAEETWLVDIAVLHGPVTNLVSVPTLASDDWYLACGDPCGAAAGALGTGLAGAGGFVPHLEAYGGACIGAPRPKIELTQALGGSGGILAYGQVGTRVPLGQGTVYADPIGMSTPVIHLGGAPGVAGAGTWELEIGNLSSLIGTSVALQAFIHDLDAPWDFAISNAVVLTID